MIWFDLLTRFFRITSLQISFFNGQMTVSLCFHFLYSCCLKAWINQNWTRKSSSLYLYNRLPLYIHNLLKRHKKQKHLKILCMLMIIVINHFCISNSNNRELYLNCTYGEGSFFLENSFNLISPIRNGDLETCIWVTIFIVPAL